MSFAVNDLAESIFKKPLQECSEAELQQFVNEYPYFAPAQLLLAKKLQEKNPALLEKQVQTTSLYFSNRLWLQHLLNGESNHHEVAAQYLPETAALAAESHIPIATEPTEALQEIKEEVAAPFPGVETIEEDVIDEQPSLIEVAKAEAIIDPLSVEEILKEEEITDQPSIKEESEETVRVEEGEQAGAMVSEEHVSPEDLQTGSIPEVLEEKPVQDTPALPEMPALKIELISPGAEVVFEPYHTVDYFASQGINFKEDEKPKDRFSQQLKSFTEWLKTMKRVPATEITTVADTAIEKKVEQLAEYSLAERHVITEAMAEVWTKQGNKLKAEEIYRKLSLLDPSKNSYFAAKIEELKKPN